MFAAGAEFPYSLVYVSFIFCDQKSLGGIVDVVLVKIIKTGGAL